MEPDERADTHVLDVNPNHILHELLQGRTCRVVGQRQLGTLAMDAECVEIVIDASMLVIPAAWAKLIEAPVCA